MPITIENHPFVTCEIAVDEQESHFIGTLSYRGYENGKISGDSLDAVRSQFSAICALIDNHGGMLRRGTIMLGYHNDELKGDVLLPDGEIIGYWEMQADDDWSDFMPEDKTQERIGAPSAWMLQDAIAHCLERKE